MELFICAVCGGPVTSITHEDGWTNWSCPCGKTMGVRAPYGELDLGIIRQENDMNRWNQYHIFEESFVGLLEAVEEPVNVCLGEVVEQEP